MKTCLQQQERVISSLDDRPKTNYTAERVENKSYKKYSPLELRECVLGWVLQKKGQVCLNTVKIRLYQGQLCLNT